MQGVAPLARRKRSEAISWGSAACLESQGVVEKELLPNTTGREWLRGAKEKGERRLREVKRRGEKASGRLVRRRGEMADG
ncbi:unnamed protein product [Linum trigynum]|uniref:Uncharacterized protein n=1 Tax=Linum trigynum TaxID=586398 RepID=A0AAV2CHF5_9ROSI